MKRLAVCLFVLLVLSKQLLADGGKVQLSRVVNGQRITVFTSPTPLIAGPVDISVFVRDEETGSVINDMKVQVTCRHDGADRTVTQLASRDASTNKLMNSAKLTLPAVGEWKVNLDFGSPQNERLSLPIYVEAPSIQLSVVSGIIIMPAFFITAFLLRERIRSDRRSITQTLRSG